MNLFSPDLLLLSAQIAALVILASALALLIGWLLGRRRTASVLAQLKEQQTKAVESSTTASHQDNRAALLAEELRRNLAAAESQCVDALEQRDEAERKAVQHASEVRELNAQLATLKAELEGKSGTEAAIDEFKASLAALEQRCKEATEQRDVAQRQAEERGAEVAKITGELADIKAKLEQQDAAVTSAHAQSEDLRQQLALVEAKHQEAAQQAAAHANELASVTALLSDNESLAGRSLDDLSKARTEADELRTKLSQTETLYHDVKQQADSQAAEVARITEELHASQAQVAEAESHHQEAARQATAHAEDLASVKAFLAEKEALSGQSEAELAKVRSEADGLRQKLEETERECLATLAAKTAAVESEGTLRHQLQSLQNSYAGTVTELGLLKQQLHDAESKTAIRDAQLEQLTKEKLESEVTLKARIAELEGHVFKPAPAVHKPSISLPKPPLPPVEVLAATVDEEYLSFPSAPEETGRRRLGSSLFDDAAVTSFSPDVPSLDDVRATLASLEQELQEKEQLVGAITAEQAQRWDELEAVRRAPPEEQHEKLHAAQKAEHSAAARLAETAEERDRCRRQARALRRSLALADEHTGQSRLADDLTRIKGIKAGISQQLHAFGIFTYRQIVEWDEDDMQAFSELLAFKNRLHRDKWQDQARALMVAKYGK